MSSYQLQAALRFEVRPHESVLKRDDWLALEKTAENVLPYVKAWFGEPEYDDEVYYDHKQHDNFTCNLVGDKLFIDYIFQNERDCYDINLDITGEQFEKVAAKFAQRFVLTEDMKDSRPDHPIIMSEKVKVLYFYNGGCAGLAEVV